PVTRRVAKPAWITLLLAASAVVTGALGETFSQIAYLVIAFCLNLAGQGVAICATTILQEEVDDTYRGRVIAVYDMAFNACFVAGPHLFARSFPAPAPPPALSGLVRVGSPTVAQPSCLPRGAGRATLAS